MSDNHSKESPRPVTPGAGQSFYTPNPSFKHRAFVGLVHLIEKTVRLISDDLYFKLVASFLSEINCVMEFPTKAGPVYMRSPSETTRLRAVTALTKEPDTLEWIEGFDSDDVLWDIGSNVGVYTLYAAKVANVRVVALEILPWNYTTLITNLTLNNLHDKVSAFCIGVYDRIAAVSVNIPLPADTWGGNGGQINTDFDQYGHPMKTLYSMSALAFTVDEFTAIEGVPFPNHIKMDIDGNEEKFLAGAKKTLADPRIKSLMFEFQPLNTEQLIEEVEALGYKLVSVFYPNHYFYPISNSSKG